MKNAMANVIGATASVRPYQECTAWQKCDSKNAVSKTWYQKCGF